MKYQTYLIQFIFHLAVVSSWSQIVVKGMITNEDGIPLIGVNVVEQGTSNGTVSDFDGTYSITIASDEAFLSFSYIGYTNQIVSASGRQVIDIILYFGIALDEVVVTALGISQEKKALGYSITEVSGEEVNQGRDMSMANSLQGRMAGVFVTQPGSGLAGATRVIIRGNSSLTGNNQPLYVVDGVVIDNSNLQSANVWGGRDFGDGISSISLDDIESISVLKGPNAAALYGQRGANGAILINTKTGETGEQLEVSVGTNFTIGIPAALPEFQNTYGQGLHGNFTHFRKEDGSVVPIGEGISGTPQGFPAPFGGAQEGPPSWGPRMEGQPYYDVFGNLRTFSPQPDNLKDFLNTHTRWTSTLRISGNSANMNYYFSGSYLQNKGLLPTNELDRYTANLRVGVNLSDRLKVDAKINYVHQESVNRPDLADEQQNVMYALRYIPRDMPLSSLEKFTVTADEVDRLTANGYPRNMVSPGSERHWTSGTFTGNPFWSINRAHNEDVRDRVIGFAKLSYEFTSWLNLSLRAGTDAYTDQILEWQDKGTRVTPGGMIGERNIRVRETNFDFLLNAKPQISDKLGVSLSIGGNAQENLIRVVGFSGSQFSLPEFTVINNATNKNSIFNLTHSKIHSLYAFGTFSYDNFLYLNWTARNDWSSTLSPDHWSFFYPSFSMGIVFSELLNLPSSFDFLKLRSSWAQAGASGNPYQIFGTYGLTPHPFAGQTLAYYTAQIPFEELQNELTTSIEFGLELNMFLNRIGLDITYYNASTENQILSSAVSKASGFGTQLINAGEVRNSGIEFFISGSPIKSENGFTWNISFNYAKNHSEIVSLTEGIDRFQLGVGDRNVDVFADVGEPYGNIYSRYHYLRDDAGNLLINGNTGLPIRKKGSILLGNALPDWTGGINNTFSYKGLSLNFLIDISQGGKIYSQGNMYMTLYGTGAWTEDFREGGLIVDGMVALRDENGDWVSAGQQNQTPVTAQQYWLNAVPAHKAAITSEFLYDADYISLREISLGYLLPEPLLSKLPFHDLRVSLVGRNVAYLQKKTPGFAPDAYTFNRRTNGGLFGVIGMESNAFPLARTYGIDLNVTF